MSAVEQLDQLTEAMERAAAGAVAPLLETRARLIAEMTAEMLAGLAAGVRDEHAVEALRRASEAGERLRQRLMVDRATRRDELGRLYHAGCLMRTLVADRDAPSRVDCQA